MQLLTKAFRCLLIGLLILGFVQPAWAQPAPTRIKETTALTRSGQQLTIATFNVENLDTGDGGRIDSIASTIVENLKAPDIIGLVEVQDNNGPRNDAVVAANLTYRALIRAIARSGGPSYEFSDIPPVDDQDGGEIGGNIRVGFLFQPERVTLVNRPQGTPTTAVTVIAGDNGPDLSVNPGRIEPTNPAFVDSRKPLAAEFLFQGQKVFVVLNHFKSRRDDGDRQRQQQAQAVNRLVEDLLQADANANVIVLGDLNDFEDSPTLQTLADVELVNLLELLPPSDRYTYVFRGRPQAIDYILVSQSLFAEPDPEIDIVHVNAGFRDQASDHDPVLARLHVPGVNGQPVGPNGGPVVVSPSPTPTPSVTPALPVVTPGPAVVSGQILPSLTGEALVDQLVANFRPTRVLDYDSTRDKMFGQIDNQGGKVFTVYTNQEIAVEPGRDPSGRAGEQGVNTEHVWPQSKGATGDGKSDLHHLLPARADVNSARGNTAFGDSSDSETQVWFRKNQRLETIPREFIDEYSELGQQRFEPREVKKGDVARAMFYFYTMYRDQADAEDHGYFPQQVAALCRWHAADPVDATEATRSRSIAAIQGNENPFVLDATLAERAYCNRSR